MKMPQKLCCYEKVTLKSKSGRFFFAQTRRRKKPWKWAFKSFCFEEASFSPKLSRWIPLVERCPPPLYYGIKYWSHELPYLDGKPPLTILTLLVVIFSRIDSLAFKQTQGMPIDLCSSYPKKVWRREKCQKKKKKIAGLGRNSYLVK